MSFALFGRQWNGRFAPTAYRVGMILFKPGTAAAFVSSRLIPDDWLATAVVTFITGVGEMARKARRCILALWSRSAQLSVLICIPPLIVGVLLTGAFGGVGVRYMLCITRSARR